MLSTTPPRSNMRASNAREAIGFVLVETLTSNSPELIAPPSLHLSQHSAACACRGRWTGESDGRPEERAALVEHGLHRARPGLSQVLVKAPSCALVRRDLHAKPLRRLLQLSEQR